MSYQLLAVFWVQVVTGGNLSHGEKCFGGLTVSGEILFWRALVLGCFLTEVLVVRWILSVDFFLEVLT